MSPLTQIIAIILNVFRKGLIYVIFVIATPFLVFAQDGKNDLDNGKKGSFWLEPVWKVQVDNRWKPGEYKGNLEDGITAEFVEYSADGNLMVTANGLGEAFILDATDGSILNTFTYITDEEINNIKEFNITGGRTKGMEVECGAFTPGGRFLVIGGNLNGVKVFDLSDNTLAHHIPVDEEVDGLAISPDGQFFAHGAHNAAQVFEVDGFKNPQRVSYGKSSGGVINSVDFTADGELMVMGGNYGHVKVVNTKDWSEAGDGIVEEPTSIKSVRFSPNEDMVASGHSGGQVSVWRTSDMTLIKQLDVSFLVEAVGWTSDGQYLLAGGRDDLGRLRVFRTSDWKLVGNPEVQADRSNIEYLDFNDDFLVIAGEDGHVRLYRVKTVD